MMKSLLAYFLLIIIIMTGCKDNTSSPDNSGTNTSHIYPLSIGNQWIYSVSDTITIDRTTSLNGKTAFHIEGDDDYTFGERNLYYEGTILYGWDGADTAASQIFDESILSTLPAEKITVPAGTFDTYKYSWGTSRIYWISKNFGVIKTQTTQGTRELLKYTIH